MMAYGRSYGEMKALQDQRRTKLNSYNADLVGRTASQLGQIATAIGGEADRIKYTSDANLLKNQGFQLENSALKTNKPRQAGNQSQTRLGKTKAKDTYANGCNLTQLKNQNVAKLRFEKQADIEDAREQASQAIAGLQLQKKAAQLQVNDARLGKVDARLDKQAVGEDYLTTMQGLSLDKGAARKLQHNQERSQESSTSCQENYKLNTSYLLNNFNQ